MSGPAGTRIPRRVIHVASGREWRGGQNQVFLLARELSRAADPLEQVVITGKDTLLARRLAETRVRTRTAGWHIGLSPGALVAAIREAARVPSLLHAHDAHALTLAGLAGMATRTPLVVTRRVVFPIRRRGLWTRAARVIAVSRAVERRLVADGIAPERITVVHSGIDLDLVRAVGPGTIRRELGVPEDCRLAVSTGALDEDKDPHALLDAADRLRDLLPDLRWVLAGDGPLSASLEARRREAGLTERVLLVGRREPHDALRLIAAADVYVTPTRAEGLGTAVLEAMALRVPVVAAHAGGVAELLAEGAGLLVPPAAPQALAEAVHRMLSDPAMQAGCRDAASQRVERFGAHTMALGVRAVYRSLGL